MLYTSNIRTNQDILTLQNALDFDKFDILLEILHNKFAVNGEILNCIDST